MLSFQIAELVDEVVEGISDTNAFVGAVQLLSEPMIQIAEALYGVGTNTSNTAYANSLLSVLNSFHERKSSIIPRKFYAALEVVHDSLIDFQNKTNQPSDYLDSLILDVDSFAEAFDTYLATPNAANAAPLALAAPRLAQRLNDFRNSLNFFKGLIQPLPSRDTDGDVLTIILSGTFDFKSFVSRLQAIQSIYSELCELLKISEIDHPLEMAKVESGSLLAKVAGSTVVIGLMVQFIQSGATYAYDNYTVEGRINAIPRRVESLDKVIGLTQKLKDAGVDTAAIDEHVAKSAHAIAKDLDTLLDKQPSIILNGLEISGVREDSRKQIPYRNVPRLTTSSEP
ncbi:hypothetical protein [Massilia timonae]|uniref:hypothetical protein n=1 Tax=Massilia timonae TaxID=47229 RepID=UPI0023569196|nr:hypothetical protein [Massilia timonae]